MEIQEERIRPLNEKDVRDTPSEQDGHQVDMYFVEQSGLDGLLRDTSGAYGDVLILRDRSCLLDDALDAVRDERERRSFVDSFLGAKPSPKSTSRKWSTLRRKIGRRTLKRVSRDVWSAQRV